MARVDGTCPHHPWVAVVHAVGGGGIDLGVHPVAHGLLCEGPPDCLSLGTEGVELSPNLKIDFT